MCENVKSDKALKTSVFKALSRGVERSRNRTADLLNAIQALWRSGQKRSPKNKKALISRLFFNQDFRQLAAADFFMFKLRHQANGILTTA